jgi:hypothetical protein
MRKNRSAENERLLTVRQQQDTKLNQQQEEIKVGVNAVQGQI